MRRGNDQHEEELQKYTEELEKDGYRVIDLAGKSPDGVAVRVKKIHQGLDGEIENIDFEISAVEVLSSQYREGKGWQKKWTWKAKKKNYSMFDDVLIHVFKQIPNDSKSVICEFRGCIETDVADYQIIGETIVLCKAHIALLKKEDPDNRTEFIYWCTDYLNRRTVNRFKRRVFNLGSQSK